MSDYDNACLWLANNLCGKYEDYRTECKGCPNAKVCYINLSQIENMKQRTEVFKSLMILAVEALKTEVENGKKV